MEHLHKKGTPYIVTFISMNVGDSAFFEGVNSCQSITGAFRNCQKKDMRAHGMKKIVTRKVECGVRAWRIE